ncbi:MAG: cytochrome c maturation protein CcmE [Gammaproteobacteria bacterium]|nr:cytochrome c maturation protein CcmE [Gammaproteobacteria bacterium]
MKPQRKKRLIAVLATVMGVSIAAVLLMYAVGENANYFYSPSDIYAGKAQPGKTIKVGGLVVPGTVKRGENLLDVEFVIKDKSHQLTVLFSDVLPDLFKEGQGIVATGKLIDNERFVATSVLAKHDENYMPPEVKRALEQSGHPVKTDTATEY